MTKSNIPFTIMCPIHNEQNYLPLSLPSIFGLNPNEVILFFDRCTDNSYEVAKKITKDFNYLSKTRFIMIHDAVDGFTMRFAYMRWSACLYSRTDLMFVTAADLILDSSIPHFFNYLKGDVKMLNFSYVDFPINPRNQLKRLMTKVFPMIGGERWLSGVHLFQKSVMFECEDLEELKKLSGAQDTHLHKAIITKYHTKYFNTDTKHLRPKESAQRHYFRGRLYWRSAKRGFFITLLSALSMFRLNLIKGYIHERFGK